MPRRLRLELAVVDRERTIHAGQALSVTGAHQYGGAFVGDRAQQREQRVALQDIDAAGRLVDHQQCRLGRERTRERHPRELRAVELVAPQPRAILRADSEQQLLTAPSRLLRRDPLRQKAGRDVLDHEITPR